MGQRSECLGLWVQDRFRIPERSWRAPDCEEAVRVAVDPSRSWAPSNRSEAGASVAFAVMGLFAGAGAVRSFVASFGLIKRSSHVGAYHS